MRLVLLLSLIACTGEKPTPTDDSAAPEITDHDGDGVDDDGDCEPGDAGSYPGAEERCDGVDNDCDGATDEDAIDSDYWMQDADGDGFGDDTVAGRSACEAALNEAAVGGDCDDGDAAINPGAAETCNGLDDDCDLSIDEDYTYPMQTWYEDADLDGHGGDGGTVQACEAPEGYAATADDCDDDDALYWEECPTPLSDPAYKTDCDVDGGYELDVWTAETPAEPELHVFGVYASLADATIAVNVTRTTEQTLVLSAYEATHWIVTVDAGVTLNEVILNGYDPQTAEVPDGVLLTNRSPYDVWLDSYAFTYPSRDADDLIHAAEAYTGLDASSFAGCYQVSSVRLD